MKDLLKAYEKDILKDGFTVHKNADIWHHRSWIVCCTFGAVEHDSGLGMQIIINF